MAAENRDEDHPVIRNLLAEGYRYEFFEAVRLIQTLVPDAPRLGHQGPPQKECIRFHPTADLSFAPSDIVEIKKSEGPEGEPRFDVATTFLSLLGSQSPLPTHYTENVLHDDSDESLVREFLDLFHHRLLSLFYRAWEKYRYSMQFRPGGSDTISSRLLTLAGLAPDLLPKDMKIPAVRFLGYSGLLLQMPRSASGLEGILNDFFRDVGVRIEGCSAQWIPIPLEQQARLGKANCGLGRDLTVGERVFDRSNTFSAVVGPVGLDVFLRFLPPGERLAEMRELVDIFNSDNLDYYVELWIKREELPELKLSSPTAMLGWSTWVGQNPGVDQCVRFLMKGWLHAGR